MTKPFPQVERRVEGQRLVYYRRSADAEFWDNHWQTNFSAKLYRWAEKGELKDFEEPFTRYLPQQGRILEAGCGLSQYVLALRVRGYDCEGVEWGTETVNMVHQFYPDLPIRVGDVTRLETPDGYYDGYISLGVVEHRQAGPDPFLKEAHRVLSDEGILLLSVPYFHPLRRAKARLGLYKGEQMGLSFYQYAFTIEEMSQILQNAGFRVITTFGYSGYKGIKDETPLLRQMVKWRPFDWAFYKLIYRWKWANRHLGHMMLFVCRKNSGSLTGE